jgi:MraZ protein
VLFTGKFELVIDAKQRLAIPARVRGLLERAGAAAALYLLPGANGVLWLWPVPTFERVAGEVDPTLTPPTEQMDFDEQTFPEAERLELDAAGRIRLPQDLITESGLGSKVLLVGMRHHLQIWDPERWAERRRQLSGKHQQIAQRAREAGLAPPEGGRASERRGRERSE